MSAIEQEAPKHRDVVQATQNVADKLWLIVVSTFAFVIIASAAALIFLVVQQPSTPTVKPELVLSLFTSAVGFLAGLFVPSPNKTEEQR